MTNNTDKAATLALALAVLDAARLHEESYNVKAFTAALREADESDRSYIDFSRYYRKSLEDCAEEAAIKHGLAGSGLLIYLALHGWWNDSLDWAEEVKKGGQRG